EGDVTGHVDRVQSEGAELLSGRIVDDRRIEDVAALIVDQEFDRGLSALSVEDYPRRREVGGEAGSSRAALVDLNFQISVAHFRGDERHGHGILLARCALT